jgi:heat shock protein HslJ
MMNFDKKLPSTKWKLIEYNDKKVVYDIFLFNEDEVSLSICNNISYGKIKITNDKIYFHKNAMSTLMACEQPLMTMESTITSMLSETLNYNIEDNNLVIKSNESKLIFKKVN